MDVLTRLADTRLITGEELFAMGDIGPCELIDGRIVPLSPTGGEHGYLELNLGAELRYHVRQHNLGWVLTGEVGIYIRRNPDRIRAADVAFVSRQRLAHKPQKTFLAVVPELVVDIISPTDLWQDIRQKIQEYFEIGVSWVWIVEPDNKDILVYTSPTEMRQVRESETLNGEGVLEGFSLSVADFFAE